MNKRMNFALFFVMFYITSIILMMTYSLSFYISDIVHIFKSPLRISFIFTYAMFTSLYTSIYVLFSVKKGRIFTFLSALFAIFYLHEIQNNMFFKSIDSLQLTVFITVIYIIAGTLAIILGVIANVFQIIGVVNSGNRKKSSIKEYHRKTVGKVDDDEQYFV